MIYMDNPESADFQIALERLNDKKDGIISSVKSILKCRIKPR